MENLDVGLLLFGLALSVWAPIELWRDHAEQARRTARARGRVVGSRLQFQQHHLVGDGFSPGTHHAVVEFQVAGRSFTVVADHGVSWRRPTPGSAVEVVYDPRDPRNAEVFLAAQRTVERVVRWALPIVGVGLLATFAVRQLGS